MKLELIMTSDGSHTISVPWMNEQYHSMNGALTESKHVFIGNGFHFYSGNTPKVFEVGFGTGLNCLLTALAAEQLRKITTYYTVEKYPLEKKLVEQINYGRLISNNAETLFSRIHCSEWNSEVKISDYFYLHKFKLDINQTDFNLFEEFDIVYFDAFGPDKQPEMWNPDLFQKIYKKTSMNGVFVTYSAKGEVRRNLAACGYEMQRLLGPPGKKEMLRGIKK